MPYVKGKGYVRSTRTKEELSKLKSEAGKKGGEARKKLGYAGVGRKRGWTKDPALKAIPAKTLTVREPDYQVFVRLAHIEGVPQVEFMHLLAESLKAKNPDAFRNEGVNI